MLKQNTQQATAVSGATSVPVGAAGGREEVYGWCCADGAPAGRDWRCVCGGEGGPLGELLEPLFLTNEKQNAWLPNHPWQLGWLRANPRAP